MPNFSCVRPGRGALSMGSRVSMWLRSLKEEEEEEQEEEDDDDEEDEELFQLSVA